MNKKEKIKKWRRQVAALFDSKCYVCEKKFGKRFHFHHLTYKISELMYRDFKNNDDYQEYILPIIEKDQSNFKLLCHKHHYLVEILKPFKPERLERLFNVIGGSVQ